MESRKLSTRSFVAATITVALGCGTVVQAAGSSPATTVTTKKMCPVCAKKIVSRLHQIDGVAEARADVKSRTFVVLPASGRVLSPRALWDIVQKGGEQPIRLAGPAGTFDRRPRQ